jgi:hypothetical protein
MKHLKNAIWWDVTPCILVESTDISEQPDVSILRVEEQTKQGTSKKLGLYFEVQY